MATNEKKSKTGRNVLVAGGVLGAIGYGIWQAGRNRFDAKSSGSLKLEGLQAPVEIIRDQWGVPHLYAESQADLFLAQGFVQAQDRFWQMELQRRTTAGRLAELFGEPALFADRFFRKVELYREAQKSYAWTIEHEDSMPLDRFCEGVNAFLRLGKLPLEITLLRYQPEVWTPTDSLSWLYTMTLGQSNNFWTELARIEVLRATGVNLAATLEATAQPGHPLIVPPDGKYSGTDFSSLLAEYSKLSDMLGVMRSNGSNAWVVDGLKSSTGKPLLANDPHISMQLPGVFYAMHLHAPDLEIIGATIPGVPGVILGHNRNIAWGVTNSMADSQDAFVEKIDPQDARRYEYKGEWLEFESRFEEIKVKDAQIVRQEQFRSIHGPIIGELTAEPNNAPIALCWSLYERPFTIAGLLKICKARNWQEFRAGLKEAPFPSLSFVYADTDGNIGYQHSGHIPIRKTGLGIVPSPGHTGEYDWTGFISFEELPNSYNPTTNYIVSANNRVTDKDYPYQLGGDYSNGARAERIRQLLNAKTKLSTDDFQSMLKDVKCLTGLRLAKHIAHLDMASGLERRAQAALVTWDGELTADSIAGCIYEVTFTKLLRVVLEPQLGKAGTDHYLGVQSGLSSLNSLYSLAGPHLLGFLERGDTAPLPANMSWDEALQAALGRAVAWLREKFGDEINQWQWGALHQVSYKHFLGIKQPLERVFNRGSFAIGGDSDTIFQTAYAFKEDQYSVNGGTPAWRMIADLAQWDNSQMSVTGGQSGSPFSPHYADLVEPWLEARLHPMLFSRAAIAKHTVATLHLEPNS